MHYSGMPYYNWQLDANNIPVVKNYNISLGGPGGTHSQISKLYEDLLPVDIKRNTYNSLSERLLIYDFIRNVLVQHHDGELIDVAENNKATGVVNLLSYIKFMEINPYYFDRLTSNPYNTLSDNLVIYSAGYPVRFEKNKLITAKNSIGLNIRFYELLEGEYYINKLGVSRDGSDDIKYDDFDLWREIKFYEYIREHVIKNKGSPNFGLIYSYFTAENFGLSFESLRDIKKKYKKKSYNGLTLEQAKNLNERYKKILKDQLEQTRNALNGRATQYDTYGALLNAYYPTNNDEIDSFLLKNTHLMKPTKYALVAITEAPHQSLYSWASKVYTSNITGPIKTMVKTGYHSPKIWKSIIFQILAGLETLNKHEICIRDMTIEDNIYIKNLGDTGHLIGHWKYIINGTEYYVPNYGYLVMIDSRYKDIRSEGKLIDDGSLIGKTGDTQYKTYGRMISDYDDDERKKFIQCFNKSVRGIFSKNFDQSFKNYGIVLPADEILDLLNDLNNKFQYSTVPNDYYLNDSYPDLAINYEKRNQVRNAIKDNFTEYLHNRIGTELNDKEKDFVDNTTQYTKKNKGDLVPMIDSIGRVNKYKWVSYIDDALENKVNVYTRDNATEPITTKKVLISDLLLYTSSRKVEQYFKSLELKEKYKVLDTFQI